MNNNLDKDTVAEILFDISNMKAQSTPLTANEHRLLETACDSVHKVMEARAKYDKDLIYHELERCMGGLMMIVMSQLKTTEMTPNDE